MEDSGGCLGTIVGFVIIVGVVIFLITYIVLPLALLTLVVGIIIGLVYACINYVEALDTVLGKYNSPQARVGLVLIMIVLAAAVLGGLALLVWKVIIPYVVPWVVGLFK